MKLFSFNPIIANLKLYFKTIFLGRGPLEVPSTATCGYIVLSPKSYQSNSPQPLIRLSSSLTGTLPQVPSPKRSNRLVTSASQLKMM